MSPALKTALLLASAVVTGVVLLDVSGASTSSGGGSIGSSLAGDTKVVGAVAAGGVSAWILLLLFPVGA